MSRRDYVIAAAVVLLVAAGATAGEVGVSPPGDGGLACGPGTHRVVTVGSGFYDPPDLCVPDPPPEATS